MTSKNTASLFSSTMIVLILLGSFPLFGQLVVEGTVTGKGDALPYANVFIKGTTHGTTTNLDGQYFLEAQPGSTIVFQYIGFQKTEKIIKQSNQKRVSLDVEMEPESFNIEEIVVSSNMEDPAYPIIRKAMDKRKFYLKQIENYSVDVYIKGLQKIIDAPEKFMGMDINIDGLDSNRTGIFYLSESESEYFYERPNNYKEIVTSSRVSGEDQMVSWNRATDLQMNFYEKNVSLGPISPRDFVGPLSPSAFFSYRYSLEGSFMEDGSEIYKIKLIPKRSQDPVFSGHIYIQKDSWRIHSLDLSISNNPSIDVLKELRINQQFAPYDKDTWVLLSQQFDFMGALMAFKLQGTFVGVYKDYELNRDFPKGFFGNQLVSVAEGAMEKDDIHWLESRPVELTTEEQSDYVIKDSLKVIRDSDSYKDSLDRLSNKFKIVPALLFGYSYRNSIKEYDLNFGSLLTSLNFNTVEGLYLNLNSTFNKQWEDKTRLIVTPKIRYGFGNKRANPSLFVRYRSNNVKSAWTGFYIGSDVFQVDSENPLPAIFNTFYTLFGRNNYHKLFEKTEIQVFHSREWFNGFKGMFRLKYQDRRDLVNTTDYSWTGDKDVPYSPNLQNGTGKGLLFVADVKITFKQQYESLPNEKYNLGSDYPKLNIVYTKAIKASDNWLDFDKIELTVYDDLNFKRLGTGNYRLTSGRFLSKNKTHLYDHKIFTGNRTFLAGRRLHHFYSMPYYQYSTTEPYFEGFYQHNFGGFILNKIPGVRMLRWRMVAGVNGMYVDGDNNYAEYFVGIANIFQIFRIDWTQSITDPSNYAVRLHLPFSL